MKENVGRRDRKFRSIAGPALLAAGYTLFGGRRGRFPGIATMLGGAFLAETALTRTCPVNEALGVDTRERYSLLRRLRPW